MYIRSIHREGPHIGRIDSERSDAQCETQDEKQHTALVPAPRRAGGHRLGRSGNWHLRHFPKARGQKDQPESCSWAAAPALRELLGRVHGHGWKGLPVLRGRSSQDGRVPHPASYGQVRVLLQLPPCWLVIHVQKGSANVAEAHRQVVWQASQFLASTVARSVPGIRSDHPFKGHESAPTSQKEL